MQYGHEKKEKFPTHIYLKCFFLVNLVIYPFLHRSGNKIFHFFFSFNYFSVFGFNSFPPP